MLRRVTKAHETFLRVASESYSENDLFPKIL